MKKILLLAFGMFNAISYFVPSYAATFQELPSEVKTAIMKNASAEDVVALCSTSKNLQEMCERFDNDIWRFLVERDFANNYHKASNVTWKQVYINTKKSKDNADLFRAKIAGGYSRDNNPFNSDDPKDKYVVGVNLRDIVVPLKTIQNADFSHSNLEGAQFYESGIYDSKFIETNLKNAKFDMCHIYDSDFSEADLENAVVQVAFSGKITLTNTDLSGADFNRSYYKENGNFYEVTLDWLKAKGAIWDSSNPPKNIQDSGKIPTSEFHH